MFVKIVYSSTYEQEQRIENLVSYFFDFVFPKYFPETEIAHFKKIGVLKSEAYAETLKRAYQIMTSLQVIITILERNGKNEQRSVKTKMELLLSKNIQLLNENGMFFPFFSNHFLQSNDVNEENSSMLYEEPTRQFLN